MFQYPANIIIPPSPTVTVDSLVDNIDSFINKLLYKDPNYFTYLNEWQTFRDHVKANIYNKSNIENYLANMENTKMLSSMNNYTYTYSQVNSPRTAEIRKNPSMDSARIRSNTQDINGLNHLLKSPPELSRFASSKETSYETHSRSYNADISATNISYDYGKTVKITVQQPISSMFNNTNILQDLDQYGSPSVLSSKQMTLVKNTTLIEQVKKLRGLMSQNTKELLNSGEGKSEKVERTPLRKVTVHAKEKKQNEVFESIQKTIAVPVYTSYRMHM